MSLTPLIIVDAGVRGGGIIKMNVIAIVSVIAAAIGLVVAIGLASWIAKADEGNDRMKEIAGYIR